MARLGEHVKEAKDGLALRLLDAKTTPNHLFTEPELAECYEGLYGFLVNNYDGSRLHQSHARNNWDILEFQSNYFCI